MLFSYYLCFPVMLALSTFLVAYATWKWFWACAQPEKDFCRVFDTKMFGSYVDGHRKTDSGRSFDIRVFDLAKTFHPLFGLRKSLVVYMFDLGKSLVLCNIFCCYIFCWAFFPSPPLPWREGKSTVLPITRLRMVSRSGRVSGYYPSLFNMFSFSLFCFVVVLYVCEVGLPLSGYRIYSIPWFQYLFQVITPFLVGLYYLTLPPPLRRRVSPSPLSVLRPSAFAKSRFP